MFLATAIPLLETPVPVGSLKLSKCEVDAVVKNTVKSQKGRNGDSNKNS